MAYEYQGQFNVNESLSNSLSEIISIFEGEDYIAKPILIEIPEHEGLVTKFAKGNPYEGYYDSINGACWNDLIENYSGLAPGKVEKADYTYFIVMSKRFYEVFTKLNFENPQEIERQLTALCDVWKEYNGILDIDFLVKRFPYLKAFFENIDKWREVTGLVTVDENICKESSQKVFNKS